MRIIFFGSDDFALTNLEALIESDFEVAAVVTQPDRARGRRGLKVTPSVVKECAKKNKIDCLQPEHIKDPIFIEQLKERDADLFVVIAYGKILPIEVLEIPKMFCINLHGSMLPKYRGAAPINWAIINGDPTTGVTIIKMNENMDAGEIISQREVVIVPEDTSITLRAKMAQEGITLLLDTITKIDQGEVNLQKQDLTLVTYAPKLTKEFGIINWEENAVTIHNMIKGLLPWPSAYVFFNGKKLKIVDAEIADLGAGEFKPGQITSMPKEGLLVATKDKGLLIKMVHPESAKVMPAKSFAIGQRINEGMILE